jgi:hypothetical protein
MPFTPHDQRTEKSREEKPKKLDRLIAIGGVLVVVASAVVAAWNVFVIKEQLYVMESQQRRWLNVDEIKAESAFEGIQFLKDGVISAVPQITVRNSGQAVAIGAFLSKRS